MEASEGFLEIALVYLLAAVALVPVFKRLGLGAVLGYLVAGMAIGPDGLGLIDDVDATLSFSEFGVVLLMFLIGLELNPAKLWQLRKPILGLGTAQVLLSALALTVAGVLAGLPALSAVAAAAALTFSSTPIALQSLQERGQSNGMVGQSAFSILLFQDIAVIPLLAIVPLFAMDATGDTSASVLDVGKIVAVFLTIIVGGRYLLRPIFRYIAATRMREVFTAFSLLLVIGTGLLTKNVGLSMALGTFMAGVLLAESEYRHELELNIEPFKGLLLGLFFIAVGMSVDLTLVLKMPIQIIAITLGFMAVKALVLYGIGKATGHARNDRILLSILMAQGGEFAFVLIALILSVGLVSQDIAALLVVVATLSMLLTPFVLWAHDKILMPALSCSPDRESDVVANENHVIIAGFGRFGQIIGRLLSSLKIPLTVLDHDPSQIEMLRKYGFKVFYGDASRLDLLEAAGAEKAKLLVLAIDDEETLLATAKLAKKHFPNLPILARARNRGDVVKLVEAGVKDVRRETFASSLEIGELALRELGYSAHQAHKTAMKFKGYDESMLYASAAFRDDEKSLIDYAKRSRALLEQLMNTDQEELSKPDKGW